MTELNERIIELISKNASVNEIVEETGLSHKRLYYRLNLLKTKGYSFRSKYYYNGDMFYHLIKGVTGTSSDEATIITSKDDAIFKAMLISDIHFGSEKERLDLVNKVYDYCIKEGINIIINGGDLIDGLIGPFPKKLETYESQIEYAIKNYPFDKSILNFMCLGNHDYDSLVKSGQDLGNALKARRHDIVPIGYGVGILNIKNDQIIIRHPKTVNDGIIKTFTNKLILSGHYHEMKIVEGSNININLPTLSAMINENNLMPGVMVAEIDFKNGYFNTGNFTSFLVTNNSLYKVGEIKLDLFKGKTINANEKVKSEEEMVINFLESEKVLVKTENQVDKFKKKYNYKK